MQRTLCSMVVLLSLAALFSGPVLGDASPRSETGATKEGGEQSVPEDSCACCQKCAAAMKSVKPKEKEPPVRNGCRECCARCGKDKKPTQEEFPPEIIEK